MSQTLTRLARKCSLTKLGIHDAYVGQRIEVQKVRGVYRVTVADQFGPSLGRTVAQARQNLIAAL